jgi:hypothetical protein
VERRNNRHPQKDGGYKAVRYWIKVYEEGSQFGINGGKISKLMLKLNGEVIANYDRGWDIEPATEEAKPCPLHFAERTQLKIL